MPAVRGPKSKSKTRRRTRDLDQIHADVRDEKHLAEFTETKAAEDLPALGEYYCKSCARWLDDSNNFEAHQKSKKHKKMERLLKEEPYTQKEADAAVGLSTDNSRGATAT
ncbi:MAG: Bud site selection protein 20 [Bogoriella megaspora]|nr:MAG: Bud site selection protein 20 [Bogoriella megaspora]